MRETIPNRGFIVVCLFAYWRGSADRSGSNLKKPGSQPRFGMVSPTGCATRETQAKKKAKEIYRDGDQFVSVSGEYQ
jgi:hypothetical protein